MSHTPAGQKEDPPIPTSSITVKNTMYEQVLFEGKKPVFAFISDKGFVEYTQKVVDETGTEYVPQSGEEITKKIILLPTEAKTLSEGDIPTIITEIRDVMRQYCDLPEFITDIAPYYALGTYIYDQLSVFPMLSFQGDAGTGKTRARDVIGLMCYKPILCNGGTTAAATYRLTEKWRGTLLIDEADFTHSDESADIIRLLNCGWSKNSPIAKCDREDPTKILFFNAYCPKILTRRKSWADQATESRTINAITHQTTRKEILKHAELPPSFYKKAEEIRNKLTTFRLAHWSKYANPELNPLADLDIEPRLMQANTTLAIILQPFPEYLAKFKQGLVEQQQEHVEQRSQSIEGSIILAYQANASLEVITPTLIATTASELQGKDVNNRLVGKLLKSLGFSVKTIKYEGKTVKQVSINADHWETLKKRFIPVTMVTSVTTVTETPTPPQYTKTHTTWLPCQICQQSPCNYQLTDGTPICQKCQQDTNNQPLVSYTDVTHVTNVTQNQPQ